MINEEKMNGIALKVYWAEKARTDVPYHLEEKESYYYNDDKKKLGKFIVLLIEDNTDNGMVAMVSADEKNKDLDELVLSFGGTNFNDVKDINTDLQMLGLGNVMELKYGIINTEATRVDKAQSVSAVEFFEKVHKIYPTAKIITTGHSLGQSLAMYISLKYNLQNIGYNGPDIHNMIDKEEVEYMKTHREQFLNYRNIHDYIGNSTGDDTKTAIYVDYGIGLYSHGLEQWRFNEEGKVVDKDNKPLFYGMENEEENDSIINNIKSLFSNIEENREGFIAKAIKEKMDSVSLDLLDKKFGIKNKK